MPRAASRVGAALAALAAASCGTHEIHATPFAVTVTGAAGDLQPTPGSDRIVVQGIVDAPTSATDPWVALVVNDPNHGGKVTIAFDPAASPGLVFPPQLADGTVIVDVAVSATVYAPDGTPIPHPAVRVLQDTGVVGGSYQFVLGEGDLEDGSGLAAIPPLLRPSDLDDTPEFGIFADNTQFEPSSCGLMYYDLLRVTGDSLIALRRGEVGSVHVDPPSGPARPPWNVRHVLSFHRSDCSRAPRVWTQFAAWRNPP